MYAAVSGLKHSQREPAPFEWMERVHPAFLAAHFEKTGVWPQVAAVALSYVDARIAGQVLEEMSADYAAAVMHASEQTADLALAWFFDKRLSASVARATTQRRTLFQALTGD